MSDLRDFRRLVLAYYRRLRKGGLTRAGAREFIGALVNSADAIDLFRIHSDVEALEDIRRVVGMVAAGFGSEDDAQRRKARWALPHVLWAEDAWAAYVYGSARRAVDEVSR